MPQTHVYDGSTTLTTVIAGSVRLTSKANMGEVGTGSVHLLDDTGAIEIVGHKLYKSEQSNCTVRTVFRGFVGDRAYKRDEVEVTDGGRRIEMELLDLNAKLGFKVIRGSGWRKRPKETITARLTALLASGFMNVVDNGFVSSSSIELDGGDLRGQRPGDVLADMAERAGFNYFVYWDESAGQASLWFANSNTSTAYSSTLRISNVAADIDNTTTHQPHIDATLRRTPQQTVSGVWMPFKNGNVYRTRAATEDTYEPRDGTAPNANVKRRAKARSRADAFLFQHRNEEDRVTVTLRLARDKVNLIREGQRISCKFSHFEPEGYGLGFNWFRVLERTVTQPLDTETYDVELVLSPQESDCSALPTYVQHEWQESVAQVGAGQPNWTYRLSLDSASTPGNLLVLAMIGDDLNTGTLVSVPDGWSSTFTNLNMKADNSGDWCQVIYKKAEGETYVDVRFTGSARGPRGMFIEYTGLTNPVQSGAYGTSRQVALGYADAPTIAYPAGAAAVLDICFMHTGPESGDAMSVSGTGHTLRTPQDSGAVGFFGSPCIAIGDNLRGTADTSGSFTNWQFQFTNDEETMVNGIVFVGDAC